MSIGKKFYPLEIKRAERELWQEVKILCIRQGITIRELIMRLLKSEVESDSKSDAP